LHTARLRPLALRLRGKADAQADEGAHVQLLRPLDDEVRLAGNLDDEEALVSHLHGVEAEVDELLVLVAVADKARLAALHEGDRSDQFRLASRLQTVGVLAAEFRDRIDHLLLLVHLDRENPAEFTTVADLLDDGAEGLVEQPYLSA